MTSNEEPIVVEVVPIHRLPGAGLAPADLGRSTRTDLNAVRDRLRDTAAQEYRPGISSAGLVVDPHGNILLAEDAAGLPGRRLSQLTTEVFYSPDLNRIAETLRANQAGNVADPSRPSEQLFVDERGNILFGDQVNPDDARRLSKVTQETFYSRNLNVERHTVATRLPTHTVPASDGEIDGWLYHVTNEFGDRYDLFLWYESASSSYLVSLIEPRLGGTVGVEDCHLYQDGTLCLKREGGPGYARLEDAYARSVLWTRGASCYRRGYGFQFNVGQEA